jgi:type II secretory pathway component PulF
MPAFEFHAVDSAGKRHRGVREGATAYAISRSLEDAGLLVLACEEARESTQRGVLLFRRRAVLSFARAIASLVNSGLPLTRAVTSAEYVTPAGLRPVLRDLRARLDRGDSFATALAAHDKLFSPVFIGIVHSGEQSGDLPAALERVAEHLEKEDEFRSRVLSAATYPLLLTVTGTIALSVLFVVVLPRFIDLLEGVGASLPRATLLLLAIARIGSRIAPFAPVLLLTLVVSLGVFKATDSGRRAIARMLLRIPLLGTMRRNALAARFARLMAVLLGGGAPALAALEHAAKSLGDPLARAEIERIRLRVREGSTLNAAMSERPFFPPLLIQLVGVGEQASKLEEFFKRSAELFERETQRTLERLVTTAEPVLVVAFGIVIGFVALALFQAIYGVNAGVMQ